MNMHVSGSAPIRLVLVDDHPMVREGLRACLSGVPRLDVVGEAASGQEALGLAASLQPDIMLVDIGMRGMNGIQLASALHEQHPGIVVVILSMYENAEYVSSAVRAGARGYVLKDAPPQEIIAAIEAAVAGGSYYSQAVMHTLIGVTLEADPLTEREREVLLLLAAGHSNKAVAASLAISVRTVETHRLNLRRKLGVDNAAGLAKYVMARAGIKA